MKPAGHIILLGLRGSGKTTLGPQLAKRLSLPFTDLDTITPQLLNRPTVAEAWQLDGEPAFRRAEAQALSDCLLRTPLVLALGGGTPTALGASDLLREQTATSGSIIIYLRAPADVLRTRLQTTGPGANRPSLTGANPLNEIEQVLAARDPLYRDLATYIIEIANKSPDQCLNEILQHISRSSD